MFNIKSLISVLLCLIIIACNDNSVETKEILPERKVSKIVADSSNYSVFTYSDGKLMHYENIRDNVKILSVSLQYSENGRVESEEAIRDGLVTERRLFEFYYDKSNRLSQIDLSLWGGSAYNKNATIECLYNTDNQIIKAVYKSNAGDVTQETEYYYYPDGNTKELISYLYGDFYWSTKYEYDTSVNPIDQNSSFEQNGLCIQKNNVTRIISCSTFPELISEIHYNYSYDSDGYPIERVTNYSDSKNNLLKKTEIYKY